MRIDRRGNMGYRKIPAFGDIEGNRPSTEVRQPGLNPAEDLRADRAKRHHNVPSTPSDAFSDLEHSNNGLLKNVANVFTAVGRALKDIKQGNAKTFD